MKHVAPSKNNTTQASISQFLSERDLERLGIARCRTLQNWRLLGIGPPYYKVTGALVRYKWSEVEAWLAARAVTPAGNSGSASVVEGLR